MLDISALSAKVSSTTKHGLVFSLPKIRHEKENFTILGLMELSVQLGTACILNSQLDF